MIVEYIHRTIEQYTKDEVRARAFKYLVNVLQKISMATAGQYLLLNVPTLMSIVDEDSPLEMMQPTTARMIIFMYETNERLARVLATNPRHNAYYKHPRHKIMEEREALLAKFVEKPSDHCERCGGSGCSICNGVSIP